MNDLLRRAWDALDTFKQAYPENWNQEDEQVLEDLMKTDLKLSGVKLKWVGLTDEEIESAIDDGFAFGLSDGNISNEYVIRYVRVIEAKLKEKNT